MQDMEENCWEFMKCEVKDECPAHPTFGKICFSIDGTLCRGEVQGAYSEKIDHCRKCDFYEHVIRLR